MDFTALKEFLTIAQTGNFTRAADQLYTTEATISRHLRKLEEEIGGALFIRSTRSIKLTALGKALLPYAEQAESLQAEIQGTIREVLHQEHTQLNMATMPVIDEYINLHELTQMFQEKNPHIEINILTAYSDISSMLLGNLCDIGMIAESHYLPDPRFERLTITRDRMIAVIPQNHPLQRKAKLLWKDFRMRNWYLCRRELRCIVSVSSCARHTISGRMYL